MPIISDEELAELREAAAKAARPLTLEEADKAQQDAMLRVVESMAGPRNSSPPAGMPAYGSTWGKGIHDEFDINDLPSGSRCRAKKLSLEDAMSLGLLESLDMFTSTLMEPIIKDGQPASGDESQTAMLKNLKDPEKRASFFGTVNRIVVHCVTIPKVVGQTNPDGSVNEGEVFAGDIPFADKMHIFRCVFGSAGDVIQPFREGSADGVAAVDEVPGV